MKHVKVATGFALLILAMVSTASVAQRRDSAGDALAGHRAEQRQWQGETDGLRRPLFYDPVDIESPVVGLPCDHLRATQPESILGEGYVVLLETLETPPRLVRYFAAPGSVASLAAARVEATRFARARAPGVELHQVAVRAFAWCR